MTHICVVKLTIIGSDNGLSPGRRQAIILTNAGILLIGPLGTNFIGILIGIQTFSFKKLHLKMSSAKWRPFCLGFNMLTEEIIADNKKTGYLTLSAKVFGSVFIQEFPGHFLCLKWTQSEINTYCIRSLYLGWVHKRPWICLNMTPYWKKP